MLAMEGFSSLADPRMSLFTRIFLTTRLRTASLSCRLQTGNGRALSHQTMESMISFMMEVHLDSRPREKHHLSSRSNPLVPSQRDTLFLLGAHRMEWFV